MLRQKQSRLEALGLHLNALYIENIKEPQSELFTYIRPEICTTDGEPDHTLPLKGYEMNCESRPLID